LSSAGAARLRREQGELGVAERYLIRAASLSSGAGAAAGNGGDEAGGGRARAVGCTPTEDWLALTEFYSGCWPPSARAADSLVRECSVVRYQERFRGGTTRRRFGKRPKFKIIRLPFSRPPSAPRPNTKNCFRKALIGLDWRTLETHGRQAQPPMRACIATTGAPRRAANSASTSSLSTSEKVHPSAATLLELGRFELLRNRSVGRASVLFKACLDESPWHASAKVGWGGDDLAGSSRRKVSSC